MAINKRIIRSNDEGGGGGPVVPTENFNTVTYTGDAGNTGNTLSKTITGVGFQPDLVWGKNRDYAGSSHALFDSVRGPEKWLASNSTGAENENIYTQATILPDGFTTGTGDGLNKANNDFVAWCWKAGGAAVTNTDGSITSQVSANPDAGFSIVGWNNSTSGAGTFTLGHGLNSAPQFIIIKSRDAVDRWTIYSETTGAQNYLQFSTAGVSPYSNAFPVVPTSSVFTLHNQWPPFQGDDYIAYCFHSVDGYQKVGTYTGTGSSGNSVVTGFEPRFLMFKRTDIAGDWFIYDNKRGSVFYLRPNSADVEGPDGDVVFYSNGFTINATYLNHNASGGTYIYLAIA